MVKRKNKFIEYKPSTTPEEIEVMSGTHDENDDESSRYAISLLKSNRFDEAYKYEVMANHDIGSIEIKDSEGYRVSYDLASNQRAFINYMELQSRNQLIHGELSQLYIDDKPYPLLLTKESNENTITLDINLKDKNISRCILQPNLMIYKMVKNKKQFLDITFESSITINYTVGDDNELKSLKRPYNSAGKLLSIPKNKVLNTVQSIKVEIQDNPKVTEDEKYLIVVNDIIISYM